MYVCIYTHTHTRKQVTEALLWMTVSSLLYGGLLFATITCPAVLWFTGNNDVSAFT